jgi:hypothetical protein
MESHRLSVSPSGECSSRSEQSTSLSIRVSRSERWQICNRLNELGISSSCRQDGGLDVDIYSPTALLQLYSILRLLMAPRQQLINQLEQCWEKRWER